VIVLSKLPVLHGLGKEAIQIFCSVCSLLEVVVKYDGFRDALGIEWVASMLRNEKLEVSEVTERSYYWVHRICDVWSI
jgi:hypothetical protein